MPGARLFGIFHDEECAGRVVFAVHGFHGLGLGCAFCFQLGLECGQFVDQLLFLGLRFSQRLFDRLAQQGLGFERGILGHDIGDGLVGIIVRRLSFLRLDVDPQCGQVIVGLPLIVVAFEWFALAFLEHTPLAISLSFFIRHGLCLLRFRGHLCLGPYLLGLVAPRPPILQYRLIQRLLRRGIGLA